ncbi:hypothetical protein ILUMI_21089 [Ignelater luminosus]|uniref:DNA mismatch repair protein MLH1 n=1 Tax=Ignelater luminosus TaxID=2038154 RepID=A0A8K0CH61_IGNLU|nr:hypothetical protein ILUMI_21089 [Ignelater luminosus]
MVEPLRIKKLDETVINRIAAGEVIQRPANALKEMIENSLDAKSTNIQITVKNGGLKYMQIQDNGCGIRKDDFEIVCERFTTSKLKEFEDLNSISTYGFRGEALASISHVAHLTIQSKTTNDKCAYRATFEDGKLKEGPKPTAGNQGTQITVEDLFYNMNVRKRALKSATEEYQKISDVVGKYAIHNAKIGFGLKKFGENNDIRTPPNSTHVDNIRTVYGNTIARELVEFNIENESFKFKAHGFMTNVNYSTKKFTFLLFINHRLVECQSLKKCIDQIYSTYLPKNSHPFMYLSLELNPRNVDVNVHPTKHEVHFLHEDQIVESITTALETKLLGSNNSRMFYTQAKLPKTTTETVTIKDKTPTKTTYDKNLVRTDSSEQKLERFFGAPIKKGEMVATSEIKTDKVATTTVNTEKTHLDSSDVEFEKHNEEFLNKVQDFENCLFDKTINGNSNNVKNKSKRGSKDSPKSSKLLGSSLLSKVARIECKLTSVLELRQEVEKSCHMSLRELFAQHVFVGCVDSTQALVQHSTKLYLCNTQKIMQELFYQFIVYNFQNFNVINLSDPLSIKELALIALDLPETGWTEEDGDKEELAKKVTEILTEKGVMLHEYFSLGIDEYGTLKSLPLLLENHIPEMAGLPMYMLRLATEVNWDEEKECFHTFAKETATYYSQLRQENTVESSSWTWLTEHVLYPAIKEYFIPPKTFTENAAVLQIANLPDLYKVFERC